MKKITEIEKNIIPESLRTPLRISLFLHVILISFLAFIKFPLPEPPPLILKISEEQNAESEKEKENNDPEKEQEDSKGHGSRELNKESKKTTNQKPVQGQIYVVKSGDSVGKIASEAGVSVQDMKKFNPCDLGENPSLIIKPGDRLMIPGAGRKEPGPCKTKQKEIPSEEIEITEEDLMETILKTTEVTVEEVVEEAVEEAVEEVVEIDPCAADQPYDESCWPLDKERPKPLVTKLAGYENVGGWFKQPIKDNNGKLMGRAEFGTSSSPLNIPKNLTDGDGLAKGTSVVVEMEFSENGEAKSEPKIILTSGYESLDKRAIAWMKRTTFKDSFNRHQMENGGILRIQFYFPGAS